MSNRRTFLQTATAAAALAHRSSTAQSQAFAEDGRRVSLSGDGLNLSPAAYAQLLVKLTASGAAKPDVYLRGGAVEELENRFARILGKEKGLFFPTGTLANHIAIRVLTGARNQRRVVVQEESHLYRDESDCAQSLSGLNLVPLGAGRATLTATEVGQAIESGSAPPYPSPVGAISIESPVRRVDGRAFDFEEMRRIATHAREKNIGLHLDGARLFLASAYTGIAPIRYASLFDTAYVSLYKYFNAPFGAILAGPAKLMDEAARLRHQFGGGILHGWESATVALHFLEGFEERFKLAVQRGEELLGHLERKGVRVHRFEGGTNVFQIEIPAMADTAPLVERAAARGIVLRRPPAKSTRASLQVNETILRRPADEIAAELARLIHA
jgi:threonine aldolase